MGPTDDESRATDERPLISRRRSAAAARDRRRRGPARLVRYYGPVLVVAVAVAAFVVLRGGGGGDDAGPSTATVDREELIRSGPMTPERAELEGVEGIDFGPRCDLATKRITLPSVYAPPCVEPFTGDNGGATSTGVTADTVKVVAYLPDPSVDPLRSGAAGSAGVERDPDVEEQILGDYIDIYNRVFETYGRRVELETYVGSGAADDEAAASADAIAISEMEPFAVIGGPQQSSLTFADELAARGVICLEECAIGLNRQFLDEHAPYVWMPNVTAGQSILAEAVGKLAGPGPAEMAGDAAMRERDRVYGVVHYDTPDGFYQEAFDTLRAGLAEYDIDLATDVEYVLDVNRVQETARTIVTRLKAAGVTTVIFAGDPLTPMSLTAEATAQDYHPEWIHGQGYLVDTNQFGRLYDGEQWQNGFGLAQSTTPAGPELANYNYVHDWAYGRPAPTDVAGVLDPALRSLFIGIHLAGPELTPETFRDGLLRYPPSGGGPTRPQVSYDGAHGGDTAIIRWDPDAEGGGMYRFTDQGSRYTTGELPDSPEAAGLFDAASSVTQLSRLPEQDRTPSYPLPEGLGG